MKKLLLWILVAGITTQTLTQDSKESAKEDGNSMDFVHPNNRTQYCHWPCQCPKRLPRCPPGISLVMDGCECCKTCAKQLRENCTEADTCDYHRGLYCDYSGDAPRYEVGICAYMSGIGCELNGARYYNGQSFQPSCKYKCTCMNGAIGCVPVCRESRPPLIWCQNPKRIKIPGECCEQWICDDAKLRKAAPRHVSMSAFQGELEVWHQNCLVQTTQWSECSKSCGMGISTRISNENRQCKIVNERRLCYLRPCNVDITKHIKEGKKCLSVLKQVEPVNFTLSGCVSQRTYRPKYCGICTDDRCCTPQKSKTIKVNFDCPDGLGFSKNMMWINSCFCNLKCKKLNDIFADLLNYPDYSEIAN
ncbi:CCN family member 4-like isoform X1 [Hypanus sabinus]|uniref:CCN family member 4-like isoform X1 n=2 Tax=Hypanus sabinus TaxID=79690 RepID=UPI0028C390B4|nr:CCN family member 4-like isoform X1 [Hypanus sabinus]